ncbi:MAG: hypothetical protein JWM31_1513 [Solirubrobacterales bacterium]|nr:hypothetical protein [Solirubrobacterales bacterium]
MTITATSRSRTHTLLSRDATAERVQKVSRRLSAQVKRREEADQRAQRALREQEREREHEASLIADLLRAHEEAPTEDLPDSYDDDGFHRGSATAAGRRYEVWEFPTGPAYSMLFSRHQDPTRARTCLMDVLVEAENKPQTVAVLIEAISEFSASPAAARQMLHQLKRVGALVSAGRGLYALPATLVLPDAARRKQPPCRR